MYSCQKESPVEGKFLCQYIENLTGRKFSIQTNICDKCKQNKIFIYEKIAVKHLLGLAKLYPHEVEQYATNAQREIGDDLAKQVLISAAEGGLYSKEELIKIAQKLKLK